MRARLNCASITPNQDGSTTVVLTPVIGKGDIPWVSSVTMVVTHPEALKRFAVGEEYYDSVRSTRQRPPSAHTNPAPAVSPPPANALPAKSGAS